MKYLAVGLLASTAMVTAGGMARAADLPTRKSAPVQYVKICDAYGAGFFYIPGTDTCLHVGGLVLAQWTVANTPYRMNNSTFGVTNVAAVNAGTGFIPTAQFEAGASRDAVSSSAIGRIDLDARTQSPFGTVRTFLRVSSVFGSGQPASTGAISNTILGIPTGINSASAARETTTLDKGFIQFAGLTMGRIQSMFDFYADAVGYVPMRGSNQSANAIAYTFTAGGGFSATLSLEDSVSHRGPPLGGLVYATPFINAGAVTAPTTQFLGTRVPDIVANLRVDQPWGSAQISAAAHQINVGIYAPTPFAYAVGPTPPTNSLLFSNKSFGFAVQGGLKFNLGMIARGDQLWLQATYAHGANAYVSGNNYGYVLGVDTSTSYGVGLARLPAGSYWNGTADADCVYTMRGTCDKSTSFAITAAFKHFWTPTLSSALTSTYYSVAYSRDANNLSLGAAAINTGTVPFIVGQTNYREFRLAANLAWNPVPGFELGTGIEWERGFTSRPIGLAPDTVLKINGLPAFKGTGDTYKAAVRMSRGF